MKLHVVIPSMCAQPTQIPTQEVIARAAQSLGWTVRIGKEPDFDWPDVLLFNHKWTQALPACRPKKVLWSFDLIARDPSRPIAEQPHFRGDIWRTMDLVLVKEASLLKEYRALGINAHWMDQACWPPENIGRSFTPKHPCDVGFPGSGYSEGGRYKLIDALTQQFNVHVWSHDNKSWSGHNAVVHAGLYDGDLGQVAVDASVIIGINYRNDIQGYWSNRIWQILGVGGCFVTHRVPGLEKFVTDGVHCVLYDTVEDAVQKIDNLLKQPHIRLRIAHQGCILAHSEQTYWHRLHTLEGLL